MSSIKFDVVIPAEHAEDTLERAVASVASSPLLGKLIVVVDEGQASFEAVQRAALLSQNVRVFYTTGVGPGAARNRGLTECSSDWIAFLDADDEYAPGYLEALADLIEAHPELPMVHTNVVRVQRSHEGLVEVQDNHPLRFRFSGGSRTVDLVKEPHMVGMSVAAAAFRRQALLNTGVKFTESLPWSEDADFIVRFLLAYSQKGNQPLVGVCAGAIYRYYVGNKTSTTASAWSNPNKYLLPFTDIYLRWTHLAHRDGGDIPVWLQNILLYEIFCYIDADRQVFHDSHTIQQDTLARCARLIQQVMASVDYATLQGYSLTSVGLGRRMLLAPYAQGAPSAPVNGQVISYAQRPWQAQRKYTYFFAGDVPVEDFFLDGRSVRPSNARWVSHELFGLEMVRERIVWLAGEKVEVHLDRRPVEVAPFAGYPKRPGELVSVSEVSSQSGKVESEGLLKRVRKALWHMRHRSGATGGKVKRPIRVHPVGERVWFYMDRAHRAGDNAEALYRYAAQRVSEARHVFAVSASSPDWQRLADAGFHLVDADDAQALRQAVLGASDLLLGDISDSLLSPLLNEVGQDQRLVFLQHGITRKQMWRWLNARRIDALVTTTTDESVGIVGDGSHYSLSAPELWQTGMPRLESLAQKRLAESRRDVLLIAPTWDRDLRLTSDRGELVRWVASWTTDWLPASVLAADSPVKPVFFVHPNMERVLDRFGVQIPVEAVFADGVQDALVRSVATVTDRSSIADEGQVVGVPAFMVLDSEQADPLGVRAGHEMVGFTFVESLDELAQRLPGFVERAADYELEVSAQASCQLLVERLLD